MKPKWISILAVIMLLLAMTSPVSGLSIESDSATKWSADGIDYNDNAVPCFEHDLWNDTGIEEVQWIWRTATTDPNAEYSIVPEGGWYFQRTFDLPLNAENISATLTSNCDNAYIVYINGDMILAQGTMDKEGPDDRDYLSLEFNDVSDSIIPGNNTILIRAMNYFSSAEGSKLNDPMYGDGTTNPAGLIFKLDVEYDLADLYNICGFKYDSDTGEPIEGWKIYLENLDTGETWSTTTGPDGRYCFDGLLAGDYEVTEDDQDGWEQVCPDNGSHLVTLPEEPMIFGIERTGARPILQIDPTDGSYSHVFDTAINDYNLNGPNGLAYDSGSSTFYYVTYPYNTTLGYADLYRYVKGEPTAEKIYDLDQELACADFYGGNYYYIAGGQKGPTDDLYEVVFDGDGNVAAVNEYPDISGDLDYAWTFSGDIAISPEGLIYGVGLNKGGGYHFFSVERDGSNFTLIDPNITMPLQLAFGSNGVLYGNNLSNNSFYTIDLTNGDTVKTSASQSAAAFNDMASGTAYYNFYNRTTDSYIPAFKFYDANADGIYNEGDSPIKGWKIEIYDESGLVDTEYTDENGEVLFTVPFGDYTVKEGIPVEKCWVATTLTEQPVSVERKETSERVEFGNLCLGCGGGKTLGFWSNKNGQKLFLGNNNGAGSIAMLNALNLKDGAGADADFTAYDAFRTWLLGGKAANMAYMLSVQLAAMELNVYAGDVDGDALLHVPGLAGFPGFSDGFATVNEVMNAANAELGIHSTALGGDAWRGYQEALKDALDRANNNLSFVQDKKCPFSF